MSEQTAKQQLSPSPERSAAMITATFEKVPGGYVLNGRLFLVDYCDTPEGGEAVKIAVQEMAEIIDAEIAARMYRECYGE